MEPYYKIIPQRIDWVNTPESLDANFMLRNEVGKYGIIKAYGNLTLSSSVFSQKDIDDPSMGFDISMDNRYGYFNTSYSNLIGKKWRHPFTTYRQELEPIDDFPVEAKYNVCEQCKAIRNKKLTIDNNKNNTL